MKQKTKDLLHDADINTASQIMEVILDHAECPKKLDGEKWYQVEDEVIKYLHSYRKEVNQI